MILRINKINGLQNILIKVPFGGGLNFFMSALCADGVKSFIALVGIAMQGPVTLPHGVNRGEHVAVGGHQGHDATAEGMTAKVRPQNRRDQLLDQLVDLSGGEGFLVQSSEHRLRLLEVRLFFDLTVELGEVINWTVHLLVEAENVPHDTL